MAERYIPELQSLCAKEIAKECREMSKEQRYNCLKDIPKHLRNLIKGFPTDFLVWCGNEMLMHYDILKHYINNSKDVKYIARGFEEDCFKGITRRKMISRKCLNFYCDETVFGCMIQKQYDVRWNLCHICESKLIPHHKWMKIKCKIESRNK